MKLYSKAVLILTFILIGKISSAQYVASDGIKKIDALFQLINYTYVDSTDDNKLAEEAIIAVLKSLDPHSVYIPKKELEKMNEPLVGNFEGVGIQFNILHDTLFIVATISGGPSEKVGLRAGDKIIEIDEKGIAGTGLQNSDVRDQLRGKKGTKVKVVVKRRNVSKLLNFTITRDKIPIYSVDAVYMINNETGYIKVNRFAKNTINEFRDGLKKLKEQNMQNLILDLRGNGGGYLQTAIQMVDEVIDGKQLVVYTEGVKTPKQEYYTTNRGLFEYGKLIVLIDEGSASASEIVTGAIQDYDRGLVVGRRSFGKGLVQKPFTLPDGSAVRLTVARYHTPSGRCIQRSYKAGKDAYYKEFSRRYKHGEYNNQDSIIFPDSLKFETINSKRTVYGGGGIMPDIFVPIDTTLFTDYFGEINRGGLFNDFTLDYMDLHRDELAIKYPSVKTFKRDFKMAELLAQFIIYAEKKDIKRNDEEIKISKQLITIRLKALIARSLFDTSAYFEVANDLNDALIKALEAIDDNTFKKEKLIYK